MEDEVAEAAAADVDGAPLLEDVDGLPLAEAGPGENKSAAVDSADVDGVELKEELDGAPCELKMYQRNSFFFCTFNKLAAGGF